MRLEYEEQSRKEIRKVIMIIGENTKYLSGIVLWGDYYDLKSICNTVDLILKAAVFSEENDLLLLNFERDIRKAKEGLKIEKTYDSIEGIPAVIYLGVVLLWPSFLFTLGLLRWGAGYIETNKRIQADLYGLEHAAQYCLKEADAEIGQKCLDWSSIPPMVNSNYLFQFLIELDYKYITFSDKAKKRFSCLPDILQMTSTLSPNYKEFKAFADLTANVRKWVMSPDS